ncbi:MAG TPA: fibronectin type III domain-containing protein, partial [Candidatus Saccharimonadales bacterium]|nr:fibronectin type III domain-containing protein [Candidatus Saccharimonadales bacterium]
PITASPYTYSWNTTGVANGTHTLSAIAKDAAGNTGTATSVSVTVRNTVSDTQPPTVPQGLSATATSSAQVSLKWDASTDNVGVTEYKVYRNGSSTALATITAPTTSTVSYTDATVSADTAYSYQVTALDAAGNQSAKSTSVSVTTPKAADHTPPSIPTGLHSTATTINSISLAWNASTDNTGGSGVAGYHLYRNGTLVASPTGTTYTNTGLAADTSYSYSVSAYDHAANGSQASAAVSVKTKAVTPPSTPTGLTATAANSAQVNLKWNASTDNVSIVSYKIYRDGSTTALATITAPTSSTVTYQDAAVSANTTYSYQVAAVNALGTEGTKSASASVTTPKAPDKTPPSVPTGLKSTAQTTTTISLAWNPSTDNTGGSGLAGYHVYRNNTLIASPASNAYVDVNLTPGTAYTYKVSAYDKAANGSAASAAITVKTKALAAPTAPRDLHSTAVTKSAISLAWDASTDTGGSGMAGYHVYRNGTLIASPTGTTYKNSGLKASTTYTYTVKAYDRTGDVSAASNTLSVKTAARRHHWWQF